MLVTDDYCDTPQETAWETLDVDFPVAPASGWTPESSSGTISLDVFAGRQIVLAFHYTSNADACYGWEIRDVKVVGVPAVTGIDDISGTSHEVVVHKVFDLTGRRVNPAKTKGVFIQNGRLYIR